VSRSPSRLGLGAALDEARFGQALKLDTGRVRVAPDLAGELARGRRAAQGGQGGEQPRPDRRREDVIVGAWRDVHRGSAHQGTTRDAYGARRAVAFVLHIFP
jgi:hypothetical protein